MTVLRAAFDPTSRWLFTTAWDGTARMWNLAAAPTESQLLDGAGIHAGGWFSADGTWFATALDVSAYSLVAVARAAMPLMTEGGSIVTLTYLGAERVVPHYNVMGVAKAALECTVRYLAYDLGPKNIRVNAISAGPIKTLAARGVSGITKMVDLHKEFAPLRRATEQGEVGDTALFLVSSLGRGITGEILYVDGGFNILGMMAPGESPVS